jgi:sugar phosphate isomerase/epimerase
VKLTFSTLACPNWSFPEMVGAASAHGIEGIDPRGVGHEIDVTRLPTFQEELDATLDLLHKHNLQLPCLNTSIALVAPASERWEMMLDECHRYAQLASRTRSSYLRIFGGAIPKNMSRDEGILLAHRHLKQLIKVCRPHGCQVVLETHDDWATSEQVLQLLSDFSPDDVGVLWDVEPPARQGEEPMETARRLAPYIHHEDTVREDGQSIPRLLGEGELPLPRVIDALREIRYDRWICLETEKRWHPNEAPEPEESLPQFVSWVRSHWH